jgi:hypothetical protein
MRTEAVYYDGGRAAFHLDLEKMLGDVEQVYGLLNQQQSSYMWVRIFLMARKTARTKIATQNIDSEYEDDQPYLVHGINASINMRTELQELASELYEEPEKRNKLLEQASEYHDLLQINPITLEPARPKGVQVTIGLSLALCFKLGISTPSTSFSSYERSSYDKVKYLVFHMSIISTEIPLFNSFDHEHAHFWYRSLITLYTNIVLIQIFSGIS